MEIIGFLLIAVAVIVIVIINKIKYRNWKNVEGKITEFIFENGMHYPVFSFTTIDGKEYNLRCKSKNKKTNEVYETSVEGALEETAAKEILAKELPILGVPVKYNPDDPNEFIPKWL